VNDLVEARRRRGSDGGGRRRRDGELGVRFLERAQLGDQGVVLGVGDLRVVVLVVAPGVVLDQLPEAAISSAGSSSFGTSSASSLAIAEPYTSSPRYHATSCPGATRRCGSS
jgi:hypothetical protein